MVGSTLARAILATATIACGACVARSGEVVAHAPLPAPARVICPFGGCGAASAASSTSYDGVSDAPRCASVVECDTESTRVCDAQGPARCTARALDVWAARGASKALPDVVALFDRACTLGDPEGCYYAGRLLFGGRGVPRDADRGIERLEHACDDGVLRACETLVRQRVGERDAKSTGSARWQNRYQLQAQCIDGDANGCFYVGLYFDRGTNGFPKDAKRGAAGYARGCDLGERVSCNNLANDYYYGDGVTQSFALAARFYERACREGEPIGCANVGFISEYGDGVPLDMKRAAEMYASGCSAAKSYACLHVEMLEEYRRGTPHDPVKAVERWRRACDGGDGKSCAYLGVMHEDGKGVPRDEARALALMKKACAAGNTQGCAWIREHGT